MELQGWRPQAPRYTRALATLPPQLISTWRPSAGVIADPIEGPRPVRSDGQEPDSLMWRNVVQIRCRRCATDPERRGNTPRLLGYIARLRQPLGDSDAFLVSGDWDPSVHRSVFVEADGTVCYQPKPAEWVLHVVLRTVLPPGSRRAVEQHARSTGRDGAASKRLTSSFVSLPINSLRCPSHGEVPVDAAKLRPTKPYILA